MKIYVYHSQDDTTTEYYDCLYFQSYLYCRRPSETFSLNRDQDVSVCYHNGTKHQFGQMKTKNITVSTVLYHWKSTLEMAEKYARYLHQSKTTIEDDRQIMCQCHHPSSFGKQCEYMLPHVEQFADAFKLQTTIRSDETWQMQIYGDILCYKTLNCNSGLLCLDWRDICDGHQQCMFGHDEENCDLLEFNECDDDEYRCMNGMCIPRLYFLDGNYDCADLTDEKGHFDDQNCIFEHASIDCNERFCLPNQWSCGDGQCIDNRTAFQDKITASLSCQSRRDQAYMCETHGDTRMWTLPHGLCIPSEKEYNASSDFNMTRLDSCQYCLKCVLSQNAEINCPDMMQTICSIPMGQLCSTDTIPYPAGSIIAPYMYFLYKNIRNRSSNVPDWIIINGTIKCRGYLVHYYEERSYFTGYKLIDLENMLCNSENKQTSRSQGGYDEFCYNSSKTFNNRSYLVHDICKDSKECRSSYRIHDAYRNCATESDEDQKDLVTSVCENLHQFRFACSIQNPQCLTVNALGDTFVDCLNQYDESWMGFGSTISKLNCHSKLKEDCAHLRVYIEESWLINSDSIFQTNTTRAIPFRAYCDTFWDYSSKRDEDKKLCHEYWVCLDNQWRCHTGQCIDLDWVLDGEWDCSDASDEEAILSTDNYLLPRNVAMVQPNRIILSFNQQYAHQPLRSICDLKSEFPCYRINGTDPLQNNDDHRPCISVTKLGDNQIDCLGGIDEKNTLEFCKRTTMLGRNFKCLTSETCHAYPLVCDQRCLHAVDDQNICYSQSRHPECSDPMRDFICYNGTCVKGGWCNEKSDCTHGEDEYLCSDSNKEIIFSSNSYYRRDKEYGILFDKQPFQLPIYPSDLKTTEIDHNTFSSPFFPQGEMETLKRSPLPFICNRGVGVTLFDGSYVCFCSQAYYGERCQYYHDRLTLSLQMNYSQSIYANTKDIHLLFKMIVLFLYNNETIDSYEFHDRPSSNDGIQSKKIDHFVYSRSQDRLALKQNRYFNRSQIIHEHPYSVRIEAYQIGLSVPPKLTAIWQYMIHFDFLPSYRFVKILYLKSFFTEKDPCLSQPCHPKQTCHRLHNDPTRYLCLCPNGSQNDDCSRIDPFCEQNYCFGYALCKANYRGLLKQTQFPYCICPSGFFGSQCYLEYEQCRSNPCQHNGTCFPKSTPGQYACLCQDLYQGDRCQMKKAAVQLSIDNKDEHRGAVVQYFDVNLIELNLALLDQRVYQSLPNSLLYWNSAEAFAELVLVRLYSDVFLGLHLLSLHMNMASIDGHTVLNGSNRCPSVRQLFDHDQGKFSLHQFKAIRSILPILFLDIHPIKYHRLCQNNQSLLCFYDDFYLCICEKNHSRVDCFGYDHSLHQCSRCLAGGQCLHGDRKRPEDFICLCPVCYSGRFCQFSSQSFSFTLDQLFSVDLLSNNVRTQNLTFYSVIFVPWLIFLIGLINNLCSFVTFRRRQCRCNGVGYYLLAICIINQISITSLACRLTHLAINITHFRPYPWFDTVLCSTFHFVGISSNRISSWLVSIISIERAYTTIFINKHWLKKPNIARTMIICLCIIVLMMGIYEIIFLKSHPEFNDGKSSICVLVFPSDQPAWLLLHQIVTVMNAVLPLTINLICVIIIIYLVIKKKMRVNQSDPDSATVVKRNGWICRWTRLWRRDQRTKNVNRKSNRLQLLRDVITENKELVIAPTFTLVPQLFSLPIFFASLLLACQTIETSPIRYLFITSCFAAFIPQFLTFFLYIKPSSFYSKQWHSTDLNQRIAGWTKFHRSQTTTKSNGMLSKVHR